MISMCWAVAAAITVQAATGPTLVRDGVALLPVVMAEDAPEETVIAAETLLSYIEKISGARLEIQSDPPADGSPAIWVGHHPAQAAVFAAADLKFEHPEEIFIHTHNGHLLITGRDRFGGDIQIEFGSANAVYTFLMRYLDVRWFMPHDLWKIYPDSPTIEVESISYRFHPIIRQRQFHGGTEAPWKRFHRLTFARREEGAALGSFINHENHAYMDWWERFSADHPEWFASHHRDGTPPRRPKDAKLCVSNPEVAQQWLKLAEEFFNENPHRIVLSATPNDGGGWCRCDDCVAMDHPDGPLAGADRYVAYWNTLARGLREIFPDRDLYVGAAAYSNYRAAPKIHRLEPNITISYVGHFPIANEDITQAEKAAWHEWSEMAAAMFYRPNLFHYSGGWIGLPTLSLQSTIEDFRFLAENHCIGIRVDTLPRSWATQGIQFYLMAKLAYDPLQDGEAVLQDFYQQSFGPAADIMPEFFQIMEEAHEEVLRHVRLGGRFAERAVEFYQKAFNSKLLDRGDAILDRAEAALVDAPESYRQRLEFIRKGNDWVRLQMQIASLMDRVRDSEGTDTAAVKKALALDKKRSDMSEQNVVTQAAWYITRRVPNHIGPPSEEFQRAAGLITDQPQTDDSESTFVDAVGVGYDAGSVEE